MFVHFFFFFTDLYNSPRVSVVITKTLHLFNPVLSPSNSKLQDLPNPFQHYTSISSEDDPWALFLPVSNEVLLWLLHQYYASLHVLTIVSFIHLIDEIDFSEQF